MIASPFVLVDKCKERRAVGFVVAVGFSINQINKSICLSQIFYALCTFQK